jgi:hypothetical protein
MHRCDCAEGDQGDDERVLDEVLALFVGQQSPQFD